MALATRCPHCGTVFRVANDQLKLRAGLVRCGACKEIFNGIEHLVPAETSPVSTEPGLPPVVKSPTAPLSATPADTAALRQASQGPDGHAAEKPVEAPASPSQESLDKDGTGNDAVSAGQPAGEQPRPVSATSESSPPSKTPQPDPLQRMTLMDFAYRDAAMSTDGNTGSIPYAALRKESVTEAESDADLIDSAIDELTRKPYRRVKPATFGFLKKRKNGSDERDPEFDEPEFVRSERRKTYGSKARRSGLAVAVGILLTTLLMQLAHSYRNQIVAQMPVTKAVLATVCNWVGCTVQLPAEIESVVIDSSELQLKPNTKASFSLSMSLHNKSDASQAWPSIELTLNDANEQPMVRRVFSPDEYVFPNSRIEDGMPARSEQSFKLNFELLMPRASGYKVYLFYP